MSTGQNAPLDDNSRQGLYGLSSANDGSRVDVWVNPITHAVLTEATGPGAGTVTDVSVVTANGFAGSVATSTTTPAITLSTTVTGVLKGDGTAISAASPNTDYAAVAFKTIAVSGQSDVVADSPIDTLTLAAGSNITLTTNATTDTVTIATNVAGDVVGPGSSTDNAVARFDSTTGKLIQNSVVIVDDSGNTSGVGTLASGAQTITSSSATALAVGPNGTTNPILQVDASTASAATGVKITGAAAGTAAVLSGTSSNANENFSVRAQGSGTLNLQPQGSTTQAFGSVNIIRTATSAFTVGQGTTNPALLVNTNTGSSATGVSVTSAAAGGGVAVAAISSGTDENLTLNAKGAGTITIAGTSTGGVTISRTTTTPQLILTANAITATANAATIPVTSGRNIVTNNSAATLTITLTTSGAVNMQTVIVQILDASAAAQTISWVNTENSTVSAPTTSNGSTTLPLTVGFIYNSATSKWRCIASA